MPWRCDRESAETREKGQDPFAQAGEEGAAERQATVNDLIFGPVSLWRLLNALYVGPLDTTGLAKQSGLLPGSGRTTFVGR